MVKKLPKAIRVTGIKLLSEFNPLSVVTQEINVSVTPSEGIMQGRVPTKIRF